MVRVLIVEDDRDLAEVERELLTGAGASCVVAHSLDEARSAEAEVLGCDAAVIDVNLGADQPSGVDVHAWLRRRGFAGSVIFLTGHARSHPLVQRAAGTAGTTIMAKPVDAQELLRAVL
jgi:DNA-binding response OmpR family regulator